jgi:hypothetical protein
VWRRNPAIFEKSLIFQEGNPQAAAQGLHPKDFSFMIYTDALCSICYNAKSFVPLNGQELV